MGIPNSTMRKELNRVLRFLNITRTVYLDNVFAGYGGGFFSTLRAWIYRKKIANWCRSTSPFFDGLYYSRANPDVAAANLEPISHYLEYGWKELRSPSPYFDAEGFAQTFPDYRDKKLDLAEVCLRLYGSYAWKVDGIVAPTLPVYPDHAAKRFSWRELKSLFKQWRVYQAHFDAEFYLREYPEVGSSPAEAFSHYMHRGFTEDRQPRSDFDGYLYRKNHGLSRNQNPFRHYVDNLNDGEFPRNPEARWILPPVLMGCNNTLSLCIHLHCYHFDLLEEIADRLANISFPFSLVVTVCSKDDVGKVRTLLGNLNNSRSTHVKLCENRGRDIAPFLIDASETWRDYDLVLHIHTKKSPHVSWGGSWRRYLLDQTIGQGPLFESIVEYFRDNPDVGFMYPENYSMIKHFTEEENNLEKIMMTAKLLNISSDFSRIAEFPAGSMAFYRVRALNNLLDNEVIEQVFEDECGQLDGTGAHALERLIPEVARQAGFRGRSYFWLSSR